MMRMFSGTLDISKEKPGFLVSVWQLNMVRSGESHVDRKGGGGVAAAATRLFTYKLAEPSKKTSRKINQSNYIVQKKIRLLVAEERISFGSRWQSGGVLGRG